MKNTNAAARQCRHLGYRGLSRPADCKFPAQCSDAATPSQNQLPQRTKLNTEHSLRASGPGRHWSVWLDTFPQVEAADLEYLDGVPGKYTAGLEQVALSFCHECEDTISLALTSVHNLLEKHSIDPRRIGRLDVGSESGPDRSKSIKSYLMMLLGGAGNHDVEGTDHVHGCYGATAALLDSVNWVESSSWDGRFALVVAADVAVYAPKSSARATGGSGAVAMLIGPNAPLVVDPAWRASYADNNHEFSKPQGTGAEPTFSGAQTINHYMMALDCTYVYLHRRLQKLQARLLELRAQGQIRVDAPFDVTTGILPLVDHVVCHSPYVRLVRKAFARMALHDTVRNPAGDALLQAAGVPARWRVCEPDALPGAGYSDKALEKALLAATSQAFDAKVMPGAWVQQQVGNTYTGSLFMGLAGLWERQGAKLAGRRILLFSFGSGTQATLFSLVGRQVPFGGEFTLAGGADKMQLTSALQQRTRASGKAYDAALQQIKDNWGRAPLKPSLDALSALPHGTWFLSHIDENHARHYARHRPTPRSSADGLTVINPFITTSSNGDRSGEGSVSGGDAGPSPSTPQQPMSGILGTSA